MDREGFAKFTAVMEKQTDNLSLPTPLPHTPHTYSSMTNYVNMVIVYHDWRRSIYHSDAKDCTLEAGCTKSSHDFLQRFKSPGSVSS